MKLGNVIASTIALCWGLAVLLLRLAGGSSETATDSGSFHAGQSAGFVLALVIGAAGARGLYKEIQRARAS